MSLLAAAQAYLAAPDLSTWVTTLSAVVSGMVGAGVLLTAVRKWLHKWVIGQLDVPINLVADKLDANSDKLDEVALDIGKLRERADTTDRRLDDHLGEADRRNARLDAHIRDHDAHRRSWRF